MSYATSSDMIGRYPNRDLVQLTNEDPTAATINTAPIVQALADASAEIDGYLECRFALPLSDPPATLNRLCTDIAMYRLQSLRPLHDLADARRRYDDAIATLQKVAAGELTIGLATDGKEPPTAADSEIVKGAKRIFGRGRLKGY
ncbi:MAG TPA: phage protein Gp36 family protein [Candidatus Binataceae bacterium]|nr:phage protein Gp36 family protein [Candidatus Binataceae bacterium]